MRAIWRACRPSSAAISYFLPEDRPEMFPDKTFGMAGLIVVSEDRAELASEILI
jgi:hypothetical protein